MHGLVAAFATPSSLCDDAWLGVCPWLGVRVHRLVVLHAPPMDPPTASQLHRDTETHTTATTAATVTRACRSSMLTLRLAVPRRHMKAPAPVPPCHVAHTAQGCPWARLPPCLATRPAKARATPTRWRLPARRTAATTAAAACRGVTVTQAVKPAAAMAVAARAVTAHLPTTTPTTTTTPTRAALRDVTDGVAQARWTVRRLVCRAVSTSRWREMWLVILRLTAWKARDLHGGRLHHTTAPAVALVMCSHPVGPQLTTERLRLVAPPLLSHQ